MRILWGLLTFPAPVVDEAAFSPPAVPEGDLFKAMYP
jgi:hypothetical protein